MMHKMIDPPEGWRYGFPKEIPEHTDDTRQWLIDNGYPEARIKELGDHFYCRYWYHFECNKMCGTYECNEHQDQCKRDKT